MNKLLIGALLIATIALGQTPSKPKQVTGTKPTSSSTTSTTMTKAMATNAKAKGPLPQPSLKEKLESGDRAIPSYKEEKDAGIHKGKAKFSPRRTKSGARKDTMKTTKL